MTLSKTLFNFGRCAAAVLAAGLSVAGCGGNYDEDEKPAINSSSRSNPLSSMIRITVFARVPSTPDTSFQVYRALTPSQRDEALSFVTNDELLAAPTAPPRGMVFVYPDNRTLAFSGRNTLIDLDVVYAVGVGEGVGRIVDITTIGAFQRNLAISSVPVKYVLMVKRGDLARSGARVGDLLYVPINTPTE
ncbi:MAG: DUF192 domain-containing protein [Armatimonadetes bacterium]|nr:DUF192 domain-containing protein [Armatimonadota bacterium]